MIHLRLIHAACWGAVLSCFGSPLARGDEPNAPAAQPPAPVAPAVQTFLGKYCTGCHGEKQAKGERRFHQLPQSIASDDSLVDFQGILDQLNLGEMPPPKAAQPTAQQRRQVIAAVTKAIAGYRATRKPVKGETVLRRLNAREYRHTIRDLFRLNTV
ncbi:MAG: c-type cytochrome domain-containing protein, partial [Pirellulaceae bacterium]|nr:c-type cytochrome domain-containing protein [Pirellulaceae bacterium]